jgi:hypothetical protein
MRGHAEGRTLETVRRSRGTTMIDWDSDNWGNHVTYADNGSWVTDKHGDDDAHQE